MIVESQRTQNATRRADSKQKSGWGLILMSTLFIVLGGIVPVLVIASTPSDGYRSWPGTLVIALLAAARFSWAVGSRTRHIVEMIVSMFTYTFLGIAPLVQLRMRAQLSTTPGFLQQYAQTAEALIAIGFIAFCVGSSLGAGKRREGPEPVPVLPTSAVPAPRRMWLVTGFALAITAYYVRSIGVTALLQPRNLLSQTQATIWANSTNSALLLGFVTMGLLVSVTGQIALFRQRRRDGGKAPVVLLSVTVLVLLVVVNPVDSARYTVGTVYLALLAAMGGWNTMRRYQTVSIAFLAGLFFVFPIASSFRNSLNASVRFQSPLQSLLSGDFDSFDQINNAVYYVASEGITWGDQLLGVLLFWVPRSVWVSKPIDTGVLLGDFRGYTFVNLSAPLWAEFFINGGWVFLIIGMLAFGYFARRSDSVLHDRIEAVGTPGIIGCVVPVYMIIVLRGSLLQAMASLGVVLLLAWVLKSRPRGDGARRDSGTSRIQAED